FPPVTGLYQIDTYGSTFDTVLAVLEGECSWGTHLECNDDDGFGSLQSNLDMLLFAGQVYTIIVDGYDGDAGEYQLNISLIDDLPGLCEDLEPLPSELPIFIGWPVDATTGNAWQECSFTAFERRFSWTPPADGSYRANQFANGMYSVLSAVSDCQGTFAQCADGFDSTELIFEAKAGEPVIIVSEWDPQMGGDISLMIDVFEMVEGCGQDLGNQVPLMFAGTTVGSGH